MYYKQTVNKTGQDMLPQDNVIFSTSQDHKPYLKLGLPSAGQKSTGYLNTVKCTACLCHCVRLYIESKGNVLAYQMHRVMKVGSLKWGKET